MGLVLLWLWCRLAPAAPMQPLAWESPYAAGAAQEIATTKKKKKDIRRKRREGGRKEGNSQVSFFCFFFVFCLFCCCCCCFLFFLFRAKPTAYGSSQARGQIGAAAAGLHHSHSNAGSEPPLQTIPQLDKTMSGARDQTCIPRDTVLSS